jgi:hypothetical protein
MIVRIILEYAAARKVEEMPYEDACEVFDACSKDKPNPNHRYFGMEHVVDLVRAAPVLDKFDIRYEVKPFKQCYLQQVPGSSSVINIHIPNIGLLAINEVRVENDFCTDALQELLNDGWRILAVCPPNSVRRPDYILGRTVQ